MDDRRRQGLCFNCNEKYAHGHNRVCQRLFFLDLSEEDEAEDVAPLVNLDDPTISLLAIAGVRTGDTMQLRINLGACHCWLFWIQGPHTISSRLRQQPGPPSASSSTAA